MRILGVIAAVLLAGCSAEPPETVEQAEQTEEQPRGHIEQAMDAQTQALDKAKGLQAQLNEAAEQKKKDIDEQNP